LSCSVGNPGDAFQQTASRGRDAIRKPVLARIEAVLKARRTELTGLTRRGNKGQRTMAKTLTDKQGDDPRGGITGRDGYIMSLALAIAVEAIERIPNAADRPVSDQMDMKRLLETMDDKSLALCIGEARAILKNMR
jgi:hypothetical protein